MKCKTCGKEYEVLYDERGREVEEWQKELNPHLLYECEKCRLKKNKKRRRG